jgi:hypothetical protein
VRCDTKCRQLRTRCLQWGKFCTSPRQSERVPPSISTGPALHIRRWHSPSPDGPGPPASWSYSISSEVRAGDNGLDASPARKWRARGRIEHTLLDGEFSVRPNRPKTFARTPLNPTIPQKVTNVSICHKGGGYVVLSRILQMDFVELRHCEVRRICLLGAPVNSGLGDLSSSYPSAARPRCRRYSGLYGRG